MNNRFFFTALFLLIIYSTFLGQGIAMKEKNENMIFDSDLTFDEAVAGTDFPQEIRANLTLVKIKHLGFDGKIHVGELVVNKLIANDVKAIFMKLLSVKFPIEKVIPIVKYSWDDEKSMQDNNTSAFNYRVIKGTTRLSKHSYGLAIDINPKLNPYVKKNSVEPKGAVYNPKIPGTIVKDSQVVKIFKSYGWKWGGDWTRGKDYQHFEFNRGDKIEK